MNDGESVIHMNDAVELTSQPLATNEELTDALLTLWHLVMSMPPKSIPVDGTEYVRRCGGFARISPVLAKLGCNPNFLSALPR